MVLSPHEIAWLATYMAGWTGQDAQIAVAVALAESGGDTNALGRSRTGAYVGNRDHGLWQISGRWHGKKLQTMGDWRDPRVNARMAKAVWDESKDKWGAWSTFTSGSHTQYMPDAAIALAAPFAPPVPASTDRELLSAFADLRDDVHALSTSSSADVAALQAQLAGLRFITSQG